MAFLALWALLSSCWLFHPEILCLTPKKKPRRDHGRENHLAGNSSLQQLPWAPLQATGLVCIFTQQTHMLGQALCWALGTEWEEGHPSSCNSQLSLGAAPGNPTLLPCWGPVSHPPCLPPRQHRSHTGEGQGPKDLTYLDHPTYPPLHHLSEDGGGAFTSWWLLVRDMGRGSMALRFLGVVLKTTDTWDPRPALLNQTFWGGVQKTGSLKTSPRVRQDRGMK